MASPTNAFSEDRLLRTAWQRQQTYSQNASRHQRRFLFLRTLLAILSVLVILLAVLENYELQAPWEEVLNMALLVLPITITAMVAFSVRFDRGQNWVLLRGSAESLKTEIYYYRTRIKPYDKENRGIVLSERIQQISDGLKGSPVHHGALAPYEAEIVPYKLPKASKNGANGDSNSDSNNGTAKNQQEHRQAAPAQPPKMGLVIRIIRGLNQLISGTCKQLWTFLFEFKSASGPQDNKYDDLTHPQDYIEFRLAPQFEWYRKQSKLLARQLQIFQTGVYVFGGVGTLLAAFEVSRSWVAVATALVGGLTNYLEVKRIESSLVGYNQAADTLYDIRAWWYALPPREQRHQEKFKRLVDSCEGTIRSETNSWLQDMQDRLAQLYGISDDDTELEHENGVAPPINQADTTPQTLAPEPGNKTK